MVAEKNVFSRKNRFRSIHASLQQCLVHQKFRNNVKNHIQKSRLQWRTLQYSKPRVSTIVTVTPEDIKRSDEKLFWEAYQFNDKSEL